MIYIVLFLLLALLLISYFCSKRSILSPSVLTSVVWIICFLLYFFLNHNLPPLSNQILFGIILWSMGLCFSSLLVQSQTYKTQHTTANITIRNIYLIISIISLIPTIFWMTKAANNGLTDSWITNIRLEAIGKGSSDSGFGSILTLIATCSFLIELFYYKKETKLRLIIPGIVCLISILATMSKTVILLYFTASIAILWFQKRINYKHLIFSGVLLISIFVLFQAFRESSDMTDSDRNDFFVLYIIGNLSSFDTLEPNSSQHWGENVFRIFYAIANELRISDIKPVDTILPFITSPLTTNTYTTLYPYYIDFGYIGISIFSLIMGCIYGLAFRFAQLGSTFATLLYSYFIHIIISQYTGDLFWTSVSGIVKLAFFLLLPFLVEKHKLIHNANIVNRRKESGD